MEKVYEDVFEVIRSLESSHMILKAKNDFQRFGYTSILNRTNTYEIIDMMDGTLCAFPSPPMVRYYRGENRYYKNLTPSLYRTAKSFDPALEIARDEIKLLDFFDILEQFPQIKLAKKDHMRVDYSALAQHYGLRTPLVDFSSDIAAAAFFATHEFRSGDYYPITQGYGYIKVLTYIPFMNKELDTRFHMIGLQPFLRPGIQCAFGLKMDVDDDTSNLIHIKKFKQGHLSKVFGWLFRNPKRMDRNIVLDDYNLLFPEEEVSLPANLISSSNSVTRDNFEKYCEENHLNIENISKWFAETGISITERPLFSLSHERELELFKEYDGRPYGDVQLRTRLCFSR